MKEAWMDAKVCAEEADQAINEALGTADNALANVEDCLAILKDECKDDATAARVERIAESLRHALQLLSAVYTDLDQLPGVLDDASDAADDAEENDEQEAV